VHYQPQQNLISLIDDLEFSMIKWRKFYQFFMTFMPFFAIAARRCDMPIFDTSASILGSVLLHRLRAVLAEHISPAVLKTEAL